MADVGMLLFDIGCAVGLLIVALIGSFLPLMLYTGGGRSLTFQLGSMLSGGVMLSAGFVHLLADSLEDLEEKVEDFPIGPFLCASGFLLVLVVDQIAGEFSETKLGLKKPEASATTQLLNDGETAREGEAEATSARLPFYTAFLLAVALCFHSVLEGLALGTEEDYGSSIDLAIAIVAHKGLAAYALGVCVIDSNATKNIFWLIMGTFSLASPVGVMVGYAISEFSDSVTSASITAVAAGTFIYVAVMEIIPNELADKGNKPEKLGAMILGFGLMSIVAIWA